jgi:hypothetical protein
MESAEIDEFANAHEYRQRYLIAAVRALRRE